MIGYLLILCSSASLVSANSLAKLLLQSQSNCNQNGCNNAYNLPIQANNIQPYFQPNMNQNSVNYCPSNQPYGSQNGQVSLEDNNKSFISKILSNPMFQNILDPNANTYNPNNNIGLQTNGQTPNVINNYYIIPPECLQGKGIDIVKNLIEQQAVVCKNGEIHKAAGNERKNNQKPQNNQNRQTVKPKNDEKRVHNNEGTNRNVKKNNARDRNTNHNNNNQRNNGNERNESKNKKNNNKNQDVHHVRRPANENRTTLRKNISKNIDKNTVKSNDSSIKNKNESSKSLTGIPIKKKKKNETLVLHHPKDDDVISDIHKKFPGIPKDVIKRLLMYLRRQICQKPHSKSNSNKINKENTSITKKKRKNSRTTSTGSMTTTTPFSTITENTLKTDNQTTIDEKLIPTTEVLPVSSDQNFTESNENAASMINKSNEENIGHTTNKIVQTPKQEKENTVHDLEQEVNDYYPDFRFDRMYMSEDDYVRSMRNDKFYYTTDRNSYNFDENSEIFYKPYKPSTPVKQANNKEIQSGEIEHTLNNPLDDYENDEQPNDFSNEEPEFQTPPFLEHPDFETKPILTYFDKERPVYSYKQSKIYDSFNVKSSTYSNAKSVNSPLKDKIRSEDIETVFAGSKVAKYGQPIPDHFDNNDNSNTIVVFAKSIHDT